MGITSPKWVTETGLWEALRDEQGVELYQTFASTPWALLTADVQIVHGAQELTRYGQTVTTGTVIGRWLEPVF